MTQQLDQAEGSIKTIIKSRIGVPEEEMTTHFPPQQRRQLLHGVFKIDVPRTANRHLDSLRLKTRTQKGTDLNICAHQKIRKSLMEFFCKEDQ